MKAEVLKKFDSLMSHLNSEENGMAEEFRALIEKALTSKTVYLVAGGTDGYTNIDWFNSFEEAEKVIEEDQESYGGMDSGPQSIEVPCWMYN